MFLENSIIMQSSVPIRVLIIPNPMLNQKDTVHGGMREAKANNSYSYSQGAEVSTGGPVVEKR